MFPLPLEQKPKLCFISMVSLRVITYLHTYSRHWSEFLKSGLCQFCLLSHCPRCTDASSGGPASAYRPGAPANSAPLSWCGAPSCTWLVSLEKPHVCVLWNNRKQMLALELWPAVYVCVHIWSGRVFTFTLSTLTAYAMCVHVSAYSVGIFIS